MTEKELQGAVVKLARMRGWMVYHTFDSRRSQPGFPDLVLVRPPVMWAVELKSAKGVVTLAQEDWLLRFDKCRTIETGVWRPKHWLDGTIDAALV